MPVSVSRSVRGTTLFPRIENSENGCVPVRKIQLSSVAKGLIAGLVAALALGIIFGPIAAVIGFCIGFASAYFSSHACSRVTEDAPRSRYSTPEEIEKDWDGFLKELDESQRRIGILRERARASRKLLDSIINPKVPASSHSDQGPEVSGGGDVSVILRKIDGDRQRRSELRRQAREALESI